MSIVSRAVRAWAGRFGAARVVAVVVDVVAVVVVVAAAGGGVACAGGAHTKNHFEDTHVSYALGEPGEGWREVQLEGSNVVWHNPSLAAGILVNSHCEGVKDAPLEGLTNDLMMGTTEREVLEQTLKPFSGREALETIATAKLDGVPRKRAMFVLKKDGCVYDVVYDAAPASFDAGLAAYHRVVDGIDVAARKDHG